MKMNAICKYLPCLIVNFQPAMHKSLLLARCRVFEDVEPTTIYMIKIFYREFVLLQSSLLTVTKLTNVR